MSKNTKRIKTVSPALTGRANAIHQQVLGYFPTMRQELRQLKYSTRDQNTDNGRLVYTALDGSKAFYNAKTQAMFILLTEEDEDELEAGQVGPQGVVV